MDRLIKLVVIALLWLILYSCHAIISDHRAIQVEPTATGWQPGDQHANYYKNARQDSLLHTTDKKINIPLRKGTYKPSRERLEVRSKAAVSCDVPLCSSMGTDILRQGGSAVDASITVALCIGSINGFSSGIGGGGFMVVKDSNSEDLSFDFRETAPKAAHKDMFKDDPLKAQFGGLAVAVPGEIHGLYEAYKRYSSGVLSWKQLFEPVIELNKRGWLVDKAFELALEVTEDDLVHYGKGDWGWLYTDGDSGSSDVDDTTTNELRPIRTGELLKRHALAETLSLIANNGSSAIFYDPEGPIAPKLVDSIQRAGGVVSLEDFEGYKTIVGEPVRGSFYGREVLVANNPSSGPALIVGLNIIDRMDHIPRKKGTVFGSDIFDNTIRWFKTGMWWKDEELENEPRDSSPISIQRLTEAMKYTSSARTELGDPSDISNKDRVDYLMSSEWTDQAVLNISDYHTHPWQDYQPAYEVSDSAGTAHFSVLDENGMAVSMTTTVNLLFGSLVYDEATGVILNSEMDDFSIPSRDNAYELRPSIYNYISPGKRPLSSTTPTIIYNKETDSVELVIGAAGGSRIVTCILQAIVRKYSYGLSLLQTVAFPRLHHQLIPETAYIEIGGRKSIGQVLKSRGHGVEYWIPRSVMNAISQEPNGEIHAVADYWRKGGGSDGY